ncbi:Aldehyde dehydrogenase B [hydrothermal vent metagenome]|uniref:aldehyde dehydrogenase (NAD(+)) n=1 Tax=hydrothermal vent metagenome TaxID=652676 RepID=A0A3B0YVX7_9ZZZZ
MVNKKNILKTLNISDLNSATCFGRNQWSSTSDNVLESLSPADGEVIAKVNTCSPQDYEAVITASTKAQQDWSMIPAPARGEFVRQIGNALREKKDALGSLVAWEMGKIKQEGDGEVQEMIDMADLAVGLSRQLFGKTMHSERPLHRMYEQWHPIGVVGVISAFNFPVAVWAWNAFVAAICGNTVVWKPSSKTPLCAIAVQHLCNKVMHEMDHNGIFSMFVPTQKETSQAFVEDSRVKLLSFTGSSGVGHYVAETVAKRLGRSLLECSGNNAIIVDDTADLSLATPAIVFGSVGTAGQRCTSTRRLFIHDKIYDLLLKKLLDAYQQIKIGDPLNLGVLMGPLIDAAAVSDFKQAVITAQAQGGKLLTGGNIFNDEIIQGLGNFVEATIIEMESQSDVVRQETFAPILYVMRFHDLADAITQQNSVPQGLSSSIFTNDMRHAEQFLSTGGSDCGIANVNIGTSGAEIGGAFGGEKETGGGREAGSDCWKVYMRRQTNTINWGSELPLAQGIKFKL